MGAHRVGHALRFEETWLSLPYGETGLFERWDSPTRSALLSLRTLILKTAAETAGVGTITETLKWGQPAYLTSETGSGSTIRLAPTRTGSDHDYAMFFICHTDLVDRFQVLFGDTFTYEGGRALLFRTGDEHPEQELRACVAMALTHHLSDTARSADVIR